MNTSEFPIWIHAEVQDWAITVLDDAEPTDTEVHCLKLALLARSNGMEKVWNEASAMRPGDPAYGQRWLCSQILDSIPLQGRNYVSRQDADQWLSDLAASLIKVQRLLEQRPANYLTFTGSARRRMLEDCGIKPAALNNEGPSLARRTAQKLLTHATRSVTHLLHATIDTATAYEPYSFTRKTDDNEAIRRYFIRSMTAGLLSELGEPKRRWVRALDVTLFPEHFANEPTYDPENHRRSIQRLTSDLAA